MLKKPSVTEPILWKTVLSVIISIVISAITSTVVAIVMALANLAFQNYSEWYSDILEQLVGGALGVYAVRLVCDRILNPYSMHVVFVALVLVTVSAVAGEYYVYHGSQWHLATQTANAISTTITAYFLFWRGVQIDD